LTIKTKIDMKQLYSLLITFLACFSFGYSQDIVLTSGDVAVSGDSVYLSAASGTDLMEFKVAVTNNRTAPVSLKVRKTEVQLVDGAEVSFCWGECYTPFVTESPMAITIPAGATDRNSFVGEYRPFGAEGTSIVRYTFFDSSDTTLSESVTVFFQMGGSGTNPGFLSERSFRVYPNPADREVRILFTGSTHDFRLARLINLAGQTCLEQPVPESVTEMKLNLERIPEGSYFLRLTGPKQIPETRKIVIRH
jgi:hypothetical protein